MTLYLIKGYLDVAATTLADAQSLYTAMLDPSDATNAATIDRVMGKIETLVQSDTGEPITVVSIDDAAGTISSWITDGSTTLALGLGDPDPNGNALYASTLSFTISGSSRTATLALNTTLLTAAVGRGRFNQPAAFTLQLQKTTSGVTETVALLSVRIAPSVLNANPTENAAPSYVTTTAARAGYVINLGAVTSITGGGATTLDGQAAGSTSFPVGCIVLTSDSSIGRHWKLIGSYISATNLASGLVKPTNSDATINPVHWKLI